MNLAPAIITLSSSGTHASSGYFLYTYTVGNIGVVNLTDVTINDTLGASGLLGTIVPLGSVSVTYIYATSGSVTSTSTAIGLYSSYYITLQQTINVV
jgi:hypothetical protein